MLHKILHLFTDIPVLVVLSTFLFSIFYCLKNYSMVKKNLNEFVAFMKDFKRNDLNFRFKEIDNWLSENPYFTVPWNEFKNTLVFSESIALKTDEKDFTYQNISTTVQNIQTTSDPIFFFNDESLVTGKFNFKLLQTFPGILTGFGPLFTFLQISVAFGKLSFGSQEETIASISGFMVSMQTAALVSVMAVGSSLILMFLDKFLYNKLCRIPLEHVQVIMGDLFTAVSAEKFLYELLRETKVQNNSTSNIINEIPEKFKTQFNATMATNLVPYLENIVYGINMMNKQLKDVAKSQKSGDVVDDLF